MCLQAGMNDYLSKPIRIQDLSKLIRRYFEMSHTRIRRGDGQRTRGRRGQLGRGSPARQRKPDLIEGRRARIR